MEKVGLKNDQLLETKVLELIQMPFKWQKVILKELKFRNKIKTILHKSSKIKETNSIIIMDLSSFNEHFPGLNQIKCENKYITKTTIYKIGT